VSFKGTVAVPFWRRRTAHV